MWLTLHESWAYSWHPGEYVFIWVQWGNLVGCLPTDSGKHTPPCFVILHWNEEQLTNRTCTQTQTEVTIHTQSYLYSQHLSLHGKYHFTPQLHVWQEVMNMYYTSFWHIDTWLLLQVNSWMVLYTKDCNLSINCIPVR